MVHIEGARQKKKKKNTPLFFVRNAVLKKNKLCLQTRQE
jgi:hypothetical protein